VIPEVFAGKGCALSWLEAEYHVLLKTIDLAVRAGFDDHAWQLPAVLCAFYPVCGHWHDGAAAQRTTLAAAGRRGNLSGQVRALGELGRIHVMTGEHTQAHATGDLSAARDAWAEALAILEDLHHLPAALKVRAKLRNLDAVSS
jgi:hypothetical protein